MHVLISVGHTVDDQEHDCSAGWDGKDKGVRVTGYELVRLWEDCGRTVSCAS